MLKWQLFKLFVEHACNHWSRASIHSFCFLLLLFDMNSEANHQRSLNNITELSNTWTEEEKEILFEAIKRGRYDLHQITSLVKTKNVLQVAQFINKHEIALNSIYDSLEHEEAIEVEDINKEEEDIESAEYWKLPIQPAKYIHFAEFSKYFLIRNTAEFEEAVSSSIEYFVRNVIKNAILYSTERSRKDENFEVHIVTQDHILDNYRRREYSRTGLLLFSQGTISSAKSATIVQWLADTSKI